MRILNRSTGSRSTNLGYSQQKFYFYLLSKPVLFLTLNKGLFTPFQYGRNFPPDALVFQRTGLERYLIFLILRHNDLFSVRIHHQISIMGRNNNLTLLFCLFERVFEGSVDEPIVEIFFRLVDNQRLLILS